MSRWLGGLLFLLVLNGCASRDAPSTKSDAAVDTSASTDAAEPPEDTAVALDTAVPIDTAVPDTQVADAAGD